jgi:hypothetical protein
MKSPPMASSLRPPTTRRTQIGASYTMLSGIIIPGTYDLSWLRDRDLLRLEIELRSSLLCKLLLLRLLLMLLMRSISSNLSSSSLHNRLLLNSISSRSRSLSRSLTINMTYDLSWLRDRDLLRLEIELRSSLLCKLLLPAKGWIC